MLFKLKANNDLKDKEFDKIYPDDIRRHSARHFTPIQIAQKAASYLVDNPKTRVLDIGAGVGKFCSVAAVHTEGYFVGVEQRLGLCHIARKIAKKYQLHNVEFIHANIMDIDFSNYDAFYFFNSFQENISSEDRIDDTVMLNRDLYYHYGAYVREQLAQQTIGTKLVTYHGFIREVPESYVTTYVSEDSYLRMWCKVK